MALRSSPTLQGCLLHSQRSTEASSAKRSPTGARRRLLRRLAVRARRLAEISVERGGDGADHEAMILPHADHPSRHVEHAILSELLQPIAVLEYSGGLETVRG